MIVIPLVSVSKPTHSAISITLYSNISSQHATNFWWRSLLFFGDNYFVLWQCQCGLYSSSQGKEDKKLIAVSIVHIHVHLYYRCRHKKWNESSEVYTFIWANNIRIKSQRLEICIFQVSKPKSWNGDHQFYTTNILQLIIFSNCMQSNKCNSKCKSQTQ